MARRWTHLIRFIAREDGQIHLGQIDAKRFPDVGLATFEGKEVDAKVVTGSIYDGVVTDQTLHVSQVCFHWRSTVQMRSGHVHRDPSLPPEEPVYDVKNRFAARGRLLKESKDSALERPILKSEKSPSLC